MDNQQRQTWLEERRKGLGGTDISAILGLNPWRTAYDVYLDKIGEAKPTEENMAMKMGTLLEPIIAEIYEETTHRKLKECELIVHKDYNFIRGTPDRMVDGEELGLEIKTLRSFNPFCKKSGSGWGEQYTDEIPQHYFLQVMWYMLLTEKPAFDVAALAGGQEFRIYTVYRDKDLEKLLIDKAEEFWRKKVLERNHPEISEHKSPASYYSQSNSSKVIASLNDVIIFDELIQVRNEIETLENKENELKRALQLSMKESESLVNEDGKVLATWKTSTSKTLDTKALKSSNIDLSAYYIEKQRRTFLVKK